MAERAIFADPVRSHAVVQPWLASTAIMELAMWRAKVLLQFILAHLPGGERINYLLQRLAGSYSPDKVEMRVITRVRKLAQLGKTVPLAGAEVAEIGTGWDAISALVFHLSGAKVIHTYDNVAHLREEQMRAALRILESRAAEVAAEAGLDKETLLEAVRRLQQAKGLPELLDLAGIHYVAPGDATRTRLPDASVDLVYSHDVLEHVPPEVMAALAKEARRILRPGGAAMHQIATGDHYATASNGLSQVHFLKYPRWLWGLLVENRISYHNRLREKQIVAIFERSGGQARVLSHVVHDRDVEAARRMRVAKEFAGLTPEELAVSYCTLLVSYPAKA